MNFNIEQFYGKHIDLSRSKRTGGAEALVKCIFHDDKTASLSVNMETGLWKCHAASCPQSEGGDMYKFASIVNGTTYEEAKASMVTTLQKPKRDIKLKKSAFPVSEDEVQKNHRNLIVNPKIIEFLKTQCKYTVATIEHFELGWDGSRIWIPIRERGKLVNIRRYDPQPADGNKMLNVAGYGEARIWPMDHMDRDDIYIMEGEKDCMLANQMGFNAVTVTGGAGTFKQDWIKLFNKKKVFICYDIDKAGIDGAKKVCKFLTGTASELKIVALPITEPANGDFTDYVLQGGTAETFKKLCEDSEIQKAKEIVSINISDEVFSTTLDKAAYDSELFFKRVDLKVRVIGKDLAPFIIPKIISLSCDRNKGKECTFCGLGMMTGEACITLNEKRPEILNFIKTTNSAQTIIIKKMVNIPASCSQYTAQIEEHQYVEEVMASPMVDLDTPDSKYVVRTLYVIGHIMDANKDYDIKAITVSDPRTQYLVHLVYKSELCESSIEQFKLTPELIEKLKVFQCQSEES